MEKNILLLVFAALSFSAAAQSKPTTPAPTAAPAGYLELLAATINEMLNTGDPASLKVAVSKLERAAAAVPTDWLPRYHQAYGNLMLSFATKEDGEAKDKYLDQADAALAQARKLGGEESELLVLQAYIYQGRLSIAPMVRSGKYLGLMNELLDQAKKINPANPRTYLIRGNNVYFTPKVLGGGPEAAKFLFEESQRRFTAFQPSSPLAPSWGERQVKSRLKAYESVAAPAAAK